MLIVSGSDVNRINLVIRQECIEGAIELRDSGLCRKAFGSFQAAAIHGGHFGVGLGIDGIDHPALSNVTGTDDAPFQYLRFGPLRILSPAMLGTLWADVIAP